MVQIIEPYNFSKGVQKYSFVVVALGMSNYFILESSDESLYVKL